MDTLAAIVLHDFKAGDTGLLRGLISRAEENRVPLFYLRAISRRCDDPYVLSQLEMWERKKREYDLGFQKILRQLISRGIQFLVVKHALYPRASYDIDILFRNLEEYRKARMILHDASAFIQPDPKMGDVKDMRGCTIMIPAEDLWSRRQKASYNDVEVCVPSNEDEITLFHLHMLKHREVFLGDILSLMSLYNLGYDVNLLSRLANKYSLISIFHFASNLFHFLKLRHLRVWLSAPLLSQFIKFVAYKKSQDPFPVKVPKFILGLSLMRFHSRGSRVLS